MDVPNQKVEAGNAGNGAHADPALTLWLQKLREMHRPEEEVVLLDM